MTSTHRAVSRAVVVLALSGVGTGLVGAISVTANADGLPNPTPLPTTDPVPLPLPGGVTDPLPLPGATDSPAPQPTDGGATDSGSASSTDGTSGTSNPDQAAGQTNPSQASAGQSPTGGVVAVATKSTGSNSASSKVAGKGASVTSVPKASAPKSPNLVKTAGGLTQGAGVATLTTAHVASPTAMTTLMHGLSLPNLPALPSLDGSALSVASAQAPVVAAPPAGSTGGSSVAAGNVGAESYRPTSSATPTGQRSPVAPALFALVAAAVAAGVAKVRIRWGRR